MNRNVRLFGRLFPSHLLITAALSLYALILAILFRTPDRIIAFFAMLLSSLGDIILMNYRPVTDRLPVKGFTAGGVVFGVSHILYATAMAVAILRSGGTFFNAGSLAAGILFLLLAAFYAVGTHLRDGDLKLMPLIVVYLFFICLNCSTAAAAAVSLGGIRIVAAAGALLFLISDQLIFLNKLIKIRIRNSDFWIWLPYTAGQILLLTGC